MSTVAKVLKYELHDVLRGRWLVAYGLFFLLATEAILRFGGGGARALLSLTNVVLLVVPLVSVVFGALYLYQSREFNELLLAQPVTRGQLFAGLYLGLTLPLVAVFLVGSALPFVYHGVGGADAGVLALLAASGALLTAVFTALAFLIAVRVEERVRGLGAALALWLLLAVAYDGVVLAFVAALGDWPLEKPVLALMLLNPVDLARVLLLMGLDVSALMGYTGAVFARFFGGAAGAVVALGALALWIAAPLALGARGFRRRDF